MSRHPGSTSGPRLTYGAPHHFDGRGREQFRRPSVVFADANAVTSTVDFYIKRWITFSMLVTTIRQENCFDSHWSLCTLGHLSRLC